MARRDLWEAGVFYGEEPTSFGPMSKEQAEALFKQLERNLDDGARAFIRRLSKREVKEMTGGEA